MLRFVCICIFIELYSFVYLLCAKDVGMMPLDYLWRGNLCLFLWDAANQNGFVIFDGDLL